jgi:hypothetical protein
MQICEGCGLPVRICDALTHYREGARLLNAGHAGAARDELGQAEAMFERWQLEIMAWLKYERALGRLH